jgi:disulfide bond formation protein DsbB
MTTNPDTPRPGQQGDPNFWRCVWVFALFAITLPVVTAIVHLSLPPAPEAPRHPWAQVASELGVDPSELASGRSTYLSSCALCHGADGQGVARLGKPLRNSAYIQEHSDDQLFDLVANGRMPGDEENTTGAVMPARANQSLSDQKIAEVVVYLRAIQDLNEPTASIDEWVISAADRSGGMLVGDLAGSVGHDLFVASCSACHGAQGEGMEGLGKPLSASDFVTAQSDEELVRFIKMGRPLWDAENTTGLDMPSKGGNPALTDEQLADIVEYIRALHEQDSAP